MTEDVASKLLAISRGKDSFRVNDLFVGLPADDLGIRHEVSIKWALPCAYPWTADKAPSLKMERLPPAICSLRLEFLQLFQRLGLFRIMVEKHAFGVGTCMGGCKCGALKQHKAEFRKGLGAFA